MKVTTVRKPVPKLDRCEETIARESAYHARACRGLLTRDDLYQEAWAYALRYVVPNFNPEMQPAVRFETYLTLAIRRFLCSHIRRSIARALLICVNGKLDTDARVGMLLQRVYRQRCRDTPTPLDYATVSPVISRLVRLPDEQRALAHALVMYDGRIKAVAESQGWTLKQTRARVHALRTVLLKRRTT